MKNTMAAEQASGNTMPMEITPFNPPYSKGENLICLRFTLKSK